MQVEKLSERLHKFTFSLDAFSVNMVASIGEAAIEMHKLNAQAYPGSANPYDSLGETYEASGKVELAIESYEKALELNPDMPSAIDALKRLRAVGED